MAYSFRERLMEKTLLCDGAMGTMLQSSALQAGQCPEVLNIRSPQTVSAVHRAYIEAGADIIETNTFGGNRVKLSSFGIDDQTEKVNAQAVKIAREAAAGRAMVGASIGPTGRFLNPVGDLDFSEAFDIFRQQANALIEAGADLILLETFSDIKELRAAVIAIRSLCHIPIVAMMTFEPVGKTLLGTSPEAAAVTLDALGVDAVGSNCGLGPEGILDILRRMASVTNLPLASIPNAGMPQLVDGKTVFPATPDQTANTLEDLLGIGTGVVGGCCGTTPAHISKLREKLDRSGPRAPRTLTDPKATRLSCRQSVLFLGGNSPIRTIGERLNPTGRKALAQALKDGRMDLFRDEARAQIEAGVNLLDVNVGVPGIDEAAAMREAVLVIQQASPVPLSLDSPRPEVIESGLAAADGKVLINSVTGDPESLKKVLPLAVRYGTAVLGLTLDEKGIPSRASDRVAIAGRILSEAVKAGMNPADVVIDCLTLSAGAEQESVFETIKALRMVREELGLNTILGISNVSFGLPARENLNAAFLAMAASAGLSAAIINPFHKTSMAIMDASRVILNQDSQAKEYIRIYSGDSEGAAASREDGGTTPEEMLSGSIIHGDPDQARKLSRELLEGGTLPMEIGESILIPAMSEVGARFASNEYFLPQVIMSASAMKAAFEPIREKLKGEGLPSRGGILMATVEGDIHDIGKNIVITLLENHGYEVFDLGKNVPAEDIVRAAREKKIDAIGLSALMTTTMIKMKEAVHDLKTAGIDIPVLIGGAAVTEDFAKEIEADGYAGDATAAVGIFQRLLEERKQR